MDANQTPVLGGRAVSSWCGKAARMGADGEEGMVYSSHIWVMKPLPDVGFAESLASSVGCLRIL